MPISTIAEERRGFSTTVTMNMKLSNNTKVSRIYPRHCLFYTASSKMHMPFHNHPTQLFPIPPISEDYHHQSPSSSHDNKDRALDEKTCQTTDSTLPQEPARSQRSSGLRSSPSRSKLLDITASLLGTAVDSSARLESVARIENTVVDVYYRIDSMKYCEMLEECWGG